MLAVGKVGEVDDTESSGHKGQPHSDQTCLGFCRFHEGCMLLRMKLYSCLCSTTVLLLLLDGPSSEEWSLPMMGVVGGQYRYTADLLLSQDSCVHSQPKLPPHGHCVPILPHLQSFLMCHTDQILPNMYTGGSRRGSGSAMIETRRGAFDAQPGESPFVICEPSSVAFQHQL